MSKVCNLYNGKPGFLIFSANISFEFKPAKMCVCVCVDVCVIYLFMYLFI